MAGVRTHTHTTPHTRSTTHSTTHAEERGEPIKITVMVEEEEAEEGSDAPAFTAPVDRAEDNGNGGLGGGPDSEIPKPMDESMVYVYFDKCKDMSRRGNSFFEFTVF